MRPLENLLATIGLVLALVTCSCDRQKSKPAATLSSAKLQQMAPFQAKIEKVRTYAGRSGAQRVIIRLKKEDGKEFIYDDTNATPEFVSNVFALNLKTNHTFPDVLFPKQGGDAAQ